MHAGRGIFVPKRIIDLVAALTVDIDEHVLGGALPQVAQTGDTEQGSSVIRPWSMNGEALFDVKGDLRPVHCHLRWGKLAVQSHFSLG